MLKRGLHKFFNKQFVQKIQLVIKSLWRRLQIERIFKRIPEKYQCHVVNLFVITIAYSVCSILIYPEFLLLTYLKEIFSIFCIYGAIFCWFMEMISYDNIMRICIALNICIAPIIFFNSSFGVAIVMMLVLLFAEYITLCYIKGSELFSDALPIYIVCETASDLEKIADLFEKYKVLEAIALSELKSEKVHLKLSGISSIEMLQQRLERCNLIPFIPTPRRIIYHSENKNVEHLADIMNIANQYSIPAFKVARDQKSDEYGFAPLVPGTVKSKTISSTDKNALSQLLKGKDVWICFDGREAVKDLIEIVSEISVSNLTVICSAEVLVSEIQNVLAESSRNVHIKIADLTFLLKNEAAPDFLFYNIPVKSAHLTEEHLKESLIKNVFETDSFIKLAQQQNVKNVCALSSTEARDASNWVGATQRLGELLMQHADFFSRKHITKFKVIRLPDNIDDEFSVKREIINSLKSSGCVKLSASENELSKLFDEKEIFPLLIKAIAYAFKTGKHAEVYTIIPNKKADVSLFISEICSEFGLKKDIEVPVIYGHHGETMELDNFPNISEPLNETTVEGVHSTAFVASAIESYETLITEEQISQMSSREIISTVFQSLAEKTNHSKTTFASN